MFTGFSPYRLMFGEECTLPMDMGLPRSDKNLPDPIKNPYALWVWDALDVAYDQVRRHSGQAVRRQKRLCDKWACDKWALAGGYDGLSFQCSLVLARIALCSGRNVHYRWIWVKTCRIRYKIRMPYGSGMLWMWPMIRSVVILVRLFGDRNDFVTSGLYAVCLL